MSIEARVIKILGKVIESNELFLAIHLNFSETKWRQRLWNEEAFNACIVYTRTRFASNANSFISTAIKSAALYSNIANARKSKRVREKKEREREKKNQIYIQIKQRSILYPLRCVSNL